LASRSADFNYKVALAEGLKKLQAGRLRQAEEQFRYLVKNFPGAEGGYRGLARVLVEQEDRSGAMRMLLDGGAALAKADRRENAIALYREAVALDASDLTAHRRLAAALQIAGAQEDAAHEYVRFINNAMNKNDTSRAQSEAAYALERMPRSREVIEVARAAGIDAPEPPPMPAATSDDRAALMHSTFGTFAPAMDTAEPKAQEPSSAMAQPPATPADQQPSMPMSRWDGPVEATPKAPAPQKDAWSSPPPLATTHGRAETVVPARTSDGDPWAAAEPEPAPAEPLEPIDANADAAMVEAQAVRFLAQGDPRGGEHAIEAARRYIAEGHVDAASDLLLNLVATGVAGHEAQRLLIEVTKSLGKKEVAKTKMKLLVEMLRLDGRQELAAEVEQLAEAI